jgi:hypothetical protein
MKATAYYWTTPYATVANAADLEKGSEAVEPRVSLVTLGVSDLERTVTG